MHHLQARRTRNVAFPYLHSLDDRRFCSANVTAELIFALSQTYRRRIQAADSLAHASAPGGKVWHVMSGEIGKGRLTLATAIRVQHNLNEPCDRIVFYEEDWPRHAESAVGFGVDLERREHAVVHVVGPNQHGQLNDLALAEMPA